MKNVHFILIDSRHRAKIQMYLQLGGEAGSFYGELAIHVHDIIVYKKWQKSSLSRTTDESMILSSRDFHVHHIYERRWNIGYQ